MRFLSRSRQHLWTFSHFWRMWNSVELNYIYEFASTYFLSFMPGVSLVTFNWDMRPSEILLCSSKILLINLCLITEITEYQSKIFFFFFLIIYHNHVVFVFYLLFRIRTKDARFANKSLHLYKCIQIVAKKEQNIGNFF